MNKNEEIKILAETATKLGVDSYCGPWLSRQIPRIQQDIQSDIFPSVTWEDMKKEFADMQALIEDAKKQRNEIIEAAHQQAKNIRTEALNYDGKVRDEVLRMVRNIEREANR